MEKKLQNVDTTKEICLVLYMSTLATMAEIIVACKCMPCVWKPSGVIVADAGEIFVLNLCSDYGCWP
jgi:hypothetical protein